MQKQLFENIPAVERKRSHYGKHNAITRAVIEAFACMDADALEKLIPENTQLIGQSGKTRSDFFSLLRNGFEHAKEGGVTNYTLGESFCENCYERRRKVVTFNESDKNGFAVLFDNTEGSISCIRFCLMAGIEKKDLEEESHCRVGYFNF